MDTFSMEMIPAWQIVTVAAVFGAMWGSFANVVIARWPEGLSVIRPASRCPACKTPIKFYDNIPVLSYFILRGRCRACKASFSPRYMIVELVMALLSVAVLNMTLLANPPTFFYGLTEYFVWFAFVWALITAGVIDLETFLLPDVITVTGIVVGLLVNIFVFKNEWFDPVAGAAGGYGFLSLFFVHGYKLVTGKSGMGEGDPKLLAMIGAFLGVRGAGFTLFVGAFQGLVIGSILVLYRRKTGKGPEVPTFEDEERSDDEEGDENTAGSESEEKPEDPRFRKARVPFGPFLALGAIEYLFFGNFLIERYNDIVSRLVGLL